jgi:hypothetical protein
MEVDAAFDVGVVADDANLAVVDMQHAAQFRDVKRDTLLADLDSVITRFLLGDVHGVVVADDVTVTVNGDVALEEFSLFGSKLHLPWLTSR